MEAFSAYAFVANNPTTAIDVDGLISEQTKTRAKYALMAVSFGAGVAATVVTVVGGFGIPNAIGAVVGGIVGGVVEFKAQQRAYREAVAAGKPPVSKTKRYASIALAATTGALSGFASAGLSAVGPALVGTGDHISARPNPTGRQKKIGRVLRAVGYAATAGFAVFNPVTASTSAAGATGVVAAVKTPTNSALVAGATFAAAGGYELSTSKTAQKRVKQAKSATQKAVKKAAKKTARAGKKAFKAAGAKIIKGLKAAKAKASK